MKIWAVSDLHLKMSEASGWANPFSRMPEADVCVVAGDICDRMRSGMEWLGRVIRPHMPVVITLGNHDLYGQDMPLAARTAPRLAEENGLTLLDDGEAVIGGVRFVGGTLWTDYRLFDALSDPPLYSAAECMRLAKEQLADFDEIYANEPVGGVIARNLTPKDTVGFHKRTVDFIDAALSRPFEGASVVVTHYAPYPRSIHQRFLDRPTSAAFASDLTDLVERRRPELWLHGHVHDSFDYEVDATRIVCNPRGYASFPNPGFDEGLVLEV